MTVTPDERDIAQNWLDLGVYDFIFSPIDPSQVLISVQQAFMLTKRRAMIVRKEQSLVYLQQRQERYQMNAPDTPVRNEVNKLLQGSIVRIEESKESLKHDTKLIEASLKRLQQSCQENELRARERVICRLMSGLGR